MTHPAIEYPVNEVFETIQGEATYTGTPSVFIRLQGCPVGCSWCDTKHTWVLSRTYEVQPPEVVDKAQETQTFAYFDAPLMMKLLTDYYRPQHIVITGGEPCLYDLGPLTDAILASGRSCQVETSGTFPIRVTHGTWVTVSPKINMPGNLEVLDTSLAQANEIKFPVGKQRDIDLLKSLTPKINGDVWVQPLSQSKSATALCMGAAIQNNWKLSIQTHKYIGVR